MTVDTWYHLGTKDVAGTTLRGLIPRGVGAAAGLRGRGGGEGGGGEGGGGEGGEGGGGVDSGKGAVWKSRSENIFQRMIFREYSARTFDIFPRARLDYQIT